MRAMPVLVTVALLAGVAAARYGKAAAARRERIEAGELRELDQMWTWVGDTAWHARFSTPPGERGGPAVVLVHGFGVSSRYFVPFAEHLAVLGDVFAPDLPGHGRSDSPARPLDIGGFAVALAGWLDVMRLARVHMIGHSMGCQIAVELALRRPDLVERLVLVGPTIDRSARSLAQTLPRFAAGGVREPIGVALLLLRDYFRAGRVLRAELRTMFDYELERAVRRLGDKPLLLVRGEHDRVAPTEWLELLARNAPNARAGVVRGAAHAAQFSDPEALFGVIGPFLAETPVPPREPAYLHSRARS